jgi:prepilin peptidase CpaA
MLFLIVFLCALFVASSLGLLSAWSDFRGMIIPNSYPLGIILAFVFAYTACALGGDAGPAPFQKLSSHLVAAGVAFLVTFIMTITKVMGGGDSKLITAYALWMGVMNMAWFLFVVTLMGAVMAVMALIVRRAKPFKNVRPGGWVARLQSGEAVVAYGIPIALGALYIFLSEGYVSFDVLKSFLVPEEVQG